MRDNIEMDLKEDLDWIFLAWGIDKWQAVMNMVVDLWVL